MQMKSMAAVALATSGLITNIAAGDAVEWRVADGGNGHWYQLVHNGSYLCWSDANGRAITLGATLVSETSVAEHNFIAAQFISRDDAWSGRFGPWIGAHRVNGAWSWTTGESWTFSAWYPGEPNGGSFEPVASYIAAGEGGGCGRTTTWNDWVDCGQVNSSGCDVGVWNYIIEWSADCNNDGIVDYGQCRDGSLPDFNGNNIPDCCEQGTACAVGSYPVEWRLEDGGNGHWFGTTSQTGTWDEMRALAVARGGDLASFASLAENEFANRTRRSEDAPVGGGPWIGARKLTSQVWQWMDGTTWGFVNWAQGEPCCGDAGLYVHLYPNGQWNDHNQYEYACRALIEWSADCNADGIVDYGQILSGSLADTNANGVPDICESTILVPSQYPTIQAAIDAVPANSQRTVQVAAGTYNESFSLNGKDVLVRGAAKNATILDGTGLITSIAKFTGGEPATAGVESLVFRNGTAGSRFTPATTFTVGGAIFATNTAAHIADCRFENCRADYGGAVYQLNGLFAWNNCVFVDNIANDEGGAVLVYNCTGSVSGSSFAGNRCGVSGPGSGSAFKAVGSNGDGESVVLDSCAFTGGYATSSGAAVEFYENIKYQPGVMRIVNTSITGNISGEIVLNGAAGLRILGRMQSCVLATGTNICNNTPKNVDGPYFIEGAVTVCGCAADITDDGVVNGGDLGVMLSNWGLASSSGVGDISHDGVVNGIDLAELLARWGTCQ